MCVLENIYWDSYSISKYKIREENDFFLIFLSEEGEYYTTNTVGKDIICFFSYETQDSLNDYLSTLYGILNGKQKKEIVQYIDKLENLNVLRRNNNERL